MHGAEGQGARGSCRSTRAGTTARATRRTRTASRPTTSGSGSSPRAGLTDILENYAQIVEEKDPKTGKKKRKQIFPRYHQLDVVRKLLADAARARRGQALPDPALGGQRQVELHRLARAPAHRPRSATARTVFDSIIVVTDRRILDQQIRDTIKQFAQVGATVGHAEHSGDLRKFIESGKKIIISTVQKFPFILDEIGDEHRGRQLRHRHRRGALQPGRQEPRRR